MQGIPAACALLALCLADRLWRCAADCDASIINSLKANRNRDQRKIKDYEFQDIFKTTLAGKYNVVLMSSTTGNLPDKTATECIKMEFSQIFGVMKIKYPDIENGDFTVSHVKGVLTALAQDEKGPVTLHHNIVYLKEQVVAFYICTDAEGDPAMSVVAVTEWAGKRMREYDGQVQEAREALENAGISGFAKIPTCNMSTHSRL